MYKVRKAPKKNNLNMEHTLSLLKPEQYLYQLVV
jgi:hypothetical protein